MNLQSDDVLKSSSGSSAITPADISWVQHMFWSVQRELWENRSIYAAPLSAAALFLGGFVISTIGFGKAQQRDSIATPYDMAGGLIMLTTLVVGVFYSLDALYGERRDRSILFWKSLPVSDLTAVLSKAMIPIVIVPLITFVVTVATQIIMFLLSSLTLLWTNLSFATLWTQVSLFQKWVMLLYHLITVHALWYAPIFAWLLLVSVWARRAPLLWAAVPVIAVVFFEKIAFNTSYFQDLLISRTSAGAEGSSYIMGLVSMEHLTHLTPGNYLLTPGLWIGLAVAAVFLAGAVRLRRYREPSIVHHRLLDTLFRNPFRRSEL